MKDNVQPTFPPNIPVHSTKTPSGDVYAIKALHLLVAFATAACTMRVAFNPINKILRWCMMCAELRINASTA